MQDDTSDDTMACVLCGKTEGDATAPLLTNATVRCGHMFCPTCVERELIRRREFPCPVCATPVKRVTLTVRSLDELQVERDTSWRRRVMRVFNQTEADFASLQDYNDYLEMVEDMIYCIVNEEPNAEECKQKIKEYEAAHKADIVLRQAQRADAERSVQDKIAQEQRELEQRRRDLLEDEKEMTRNKRKMKVESTQVLLGEREEVSAELKQAQMMGYRNELTRQRRGQRAATPFVSPKVREPSDGWHKEAPMDRQVYLKQQAAGGGIPTGSIVSQERLWNETISSLFVGLG